MTTDCVDVLVIEDDAVTRAGIIERVSEHPEANVVGAVGSLHDARCILASQAVDLVLIDLQLEDGNGIELIEELYERAPQTLMLVISVFGDEHSVVGAIAAGASGYLLKDDSAARVGDAIRELLEGGSPISPGIARHLIQRFHNQRVAPDPEVTLSEREQEVLHYASRGYTYAESAKLMGVSVNTVSSYTRRVYTKLSVTSRSQAVFEAQRLGLVRGPDR